MCVYQQILIQRFCKLVTCFSFLYYGWLGLEGVSKFGTFDFGIFKIYKKMCRVIYFGFTTFTKTSYTISYLCCV